MCLDKGSGFHLVVGGSRFRFLGDYIRAEGLGCRDCGKPNHGGADEKDNGLLGGHFSNIVGFSSTILLEATRETEVLPS